MDDPFGIEKSKKGKAKDAALAAGGAGTLAGTASLPRLEHAIVRHKKAGIDRKISRLEASRPAKPTTQRNYMGNKAPSAKPAQKAARTAKLKNITGQVSELNRAKKAIVKPHLAGNAKATWTGIAVGAPALWYGARHLASENDKVKKDLNITEISKEIKRRDVDAGIVGAAAGAGGYQEASYSLKRFDRRAEQKIASDPKMSREARAYQNKMRPKNAKAGDPAWRPYFRNYPKHLPGGKLKRTLAVTHTGKTGAAATVAAGAAGAVGAAALARKATRKKEPKVDVNKAMSLGGLKKIPAAARLQGVGAKRALSDAAGSSKVQGMIKSPAGKNAVKGAKNYMNTHPKVKTAALLAGSTATGAAVAAPFTRKKDQMSKGLDTSAFGVYHGYEVVEKKEKELSNMRTAFGGLAPVAHGAVAGKPGKKSDAMAHEMFGAVGTRAAQKKGYYKKTKKGKY